MRAELSIDQALASTVVLEAGQRPYGAKIRRPDVPHCEGKLPQAATKRNLLAFQLLLQRPHKSSIFPPVFRRTGKDLTYRARMKQIKQVLLKRSAGYLSKEERPQLVRGFQLTWIRDGPQNAPSCCDIAVRPFKGGEYL
jgi:hypothetical protein